MYILRIYLLLLCPRYPGKAGSAEEVRSAPLVLRRESSLFGFWLKPHEK